MDNSETTLHELHEKIREGLDLSFKNLLEKKRRNDEVFVFSESGKIVKVKATDIKD